MNIVQELTSLAEERCNSDASCRGFNSEGLRKSSIKPLDQWVKLAGFSQCRGLYIKTPDTFIVNGKQLTSEESKWMGWIADYTIPNTKLSRSDAVHKIARGAWWSLKEGVLNMASWSQKVSNPFLHSLCLFVDGTQDQIGPTDICETSTWQVGIAAEQPTQYLLADLENKAKLFYGSVKIALSQTVKQAGFNESSPEYGEILDHDAPADLKRAWLVNNHLIGLSIVSDKIEEQCMDPQSAAFWCYGDYGGECSYCTRYAPDAASIPAIIDDVVVLLQSLGGGKCEPVHLVGYDLYPSYDSELFDISQEEFSSLMELWETCDKNPSCRGFNTNGYIKSHIRPQEDWTKFVGNSKCGDGLYVRKMDHHIEALLTIAAGEIGVIEDKADDEDIAGRIAEYRSVSTSGVVSPTRGPEWWCADFTSWVFWEAGFPLGPEGLGYFNTQSMMNWLATEGYWHYQYEDYEPQPGDIVLFNWEGAGSGLVDHVGIVESVNPDGTLITIEGNTNDPTGQQPQGVYRKTDTNPVEGYGSFLRQVSL
mmetsp:Transcript_33219/g.58194  ORF Transcript_33219/g.58194 Transcript_33219/m.58194 type:complete len:535 (+) Transcript_33219:427-2031(+)